MNRLIQYEIIQSLYIQGEMKGFCHVQENTMIKCNTFCEEGLYYQLKIHYIYLEPPNNKHCLSLKALQFAQLSQHKSLDKTR